VKPIQKWCVPAISGTGDDGVCLMTVLVTRLVWWLAVYFA